MARPIWCWNVVDATKKTCGYCYNCVGGVMPTTCPECKQAARWTTNKPDGGQDPICDFTVDPGEPIVLTVAPGDNPKEPYQINRNDVRFLHSIRVDPEVPPTRSETTG